MHYMIALGPEAERFYQAIAENAGLSVERVLADALFQYAGELAERALAGRSPYPN